MTGASPRVEMRGICKRFGEVIALDRVDLEAAKGEIHALLGENGAGKTTIMNILSGLYRADAGEIRIDGAPARIRSPKNAIALRIGMVHQHVELIGNFTALENILLGHEGSRWLLRTENQRGTVEQVASRYGLSVPLDARVKALPVGIQQKIEILKALCRGADVLILDEPTTMLTPQEVDALFATIRKIAEGGLTVIFITHKIKEVLANSDRITVFRGGRNVGTVRRVEASREVLVQMMVGERGMVSSADRSRGGAALSGPPALSVQGLSIRHGDIHLLKDVSFDVPSGAIVGLAGVSGNGQRELAEAIAGLLPIQSGEVMVRGRSAKHLAVAARIGLGLVLIPQNRIEEGILPSLSLAENFVLGLHPYLLKQLGFMGARFFDQESARAMARAAIQEYNVLARNENVPSAHLSGGNIQKVVVARAMALFRSIRGAALIANNPTRGLDIMASAFVHARLREVRDGGGGVLLISEDLDELFALCDRVLVIHSGEILGSFDGPGYDAYLIGALMAGEREKPSA
ncbi:MAG: ABC transporter ATP-binding protein [Nitrospinota bacterium]